MVTITIKDNYKFSRTGFEDIDDLYNYLSLEFSDEFKAELDQREKDILSRKEKGIAWEDVKSKLTAKLN